MVSFQPVWWEAGRGRGIGNGFGQAFRGCLRHLYCYSKLWGGELWGRVSKKYGLFQLRPRKYSIMLRIISGVVIVYFGAQLPSFTLEETREPSYTYFQYQESPCSLSHL